MRGRFDDIVPVSPHTRGWTPLDLVAPQQPRGFPAHAGMDPFRAHSTRRRPWFPRTRGDGPTVDGWPDETHRVSPHTRGWTRLPRGADRRVNGFPAHAGMDPPADIPRHIVLVVSPHTRGWTREHGRAVGRRLGFPAHAGMDPSHKAPMVRCTRFPPHTRGWTVHRVADPPAAGGFPAHAGMDPTATPGPISARRFPRTRGDGPRKVAGGSMNTRVSPHTRGWTRSSYRPASSLSGFPAHAGMDPAWLRADDPAYWFPRTRGDGPVP